MDNGNHTNTNQKENDMYAHYFKSGKQHLITISETVRPVGKTVAVESKKAAKEYIKTNGLTGWNI